MKIFGFTGLSGNGKTELILQLITLFKEDNITVSAVKHAHEGFDIDKPGKDSFRYRKEGARETLIASASRWALLHENLGEEEADLNALLQKLEPVNLVLIEGFKRQPIPRLEVWRKDGGNPCLALQDKKNEYNISAVAAPNNDIEALQKEFQKREITLLPIDDIQAIASFVLARAENF